ncbi:MAG: hypothetical protein ABSG57_12045 [Candidatus Bathyarchaeia archaeon]
MSRDTSSCGSDGNVRSLSLYATMSLAEALDSIHKQLVRVLLFFAAKACGVVPNSSQYLVSRSR